MRGDWLYEGVTTHWKAGEKEMEDDGYQIHCCGKHFPNCMMVVCQIEGLHDYAYHAVLFNRGFC